MAAALLRVSSGANVMGTFSLSHWLVVLAIVLILFGAGRIPKAMGDLARGIRAFRTGMREDTAAESEGEKLVEARPADHHRA
jgi:sec-independent protein translocase protein TatA